MEVNSEPRNRNLGTIKKPVNNLCIVDKSPNIYCGERMYPHKMWIEIVDMLITFVDKLLLTG